MAQRIIDLFPEHTHYVEPFFGGGSILFAKRPSVAETVNDIHGALVTFYRVLRDPDLFNALQRLCALTPYSREEWAACRDAWPTEADPVQQAWQFFVTARMVFGGDTENGGWRYTVGGGTTATQRWLSCVERLPALHQRLRAVQVECRDWSEILLAFDGPSTLFYCDPPYVLDTRGLDARYRHEMTREDHSRLVASLLSLRGMVVLSGYADADLHQPLCEAGWEQQTLDVACPTGHARASTRSRRTESVWSNPAAVAARRQPSLFAGAEERGGA